MTLTHLVVRHVREAAGPSTEALRDLHERMPAALAVVGVTTLLFFILAVAVRYTYGELVAALAFVESPTETVIVSTPASPTKPLLDFDDDDKKAAKEADDIDAPPPYEEEVLLVRSRPLTASLRGTLQHLRARTGDRRHAARFRGLVLHVLHAMAVHLIASFFASDPSEMVRKAGALQALAMRTLAVVAAAVIASPLALAWTHHVIADPASSRPWMRRVFALPWAAMKRVVVPAALLAVAEQVTVLLPALLFVAYAMQAEAAAPEAFAHHLGGCATLAVAGGLSLLALLLAVLLVFPAQAAFVRVAASTAPADEDCVVPFDGSFGGYVKDGRLGVADAWRSFGWAARFRVLGVYAKVFGIQMALLVGWFVIVVAEVRFIAGKAAFNIPRKNGDFYF